MNTIKCFPQVDEADMQGTIPLNTLLYDVPIYAASTFTKPCLFLSQLS